VNYFNLLLGNQQIKKSFQFWNYHLKKSVEEKFIGVFTSEEKNIAFDLKGEILHGMGMYACIRKLWQMTGVKIRKHAKEEFRGSPSEFEFKDPDMEVLSTRTKHLNLGTWANGMLCFLTALESSSGTRSRLLKSAEKYLSDLVACNKPLVMLELGRVFSTMATENTAMDLKIQNFNKADMFFNSIFHLSCAPAIKILSNLLLAKLHYIRFKTEYDNLDSEQRKEYLRQSAQNCKKFFEDGNANLGDKWMMDFDFTKLSLCSPDAVKETFITWAKALFKLSILAGESDGQETEIQFLEMAELELQSAILLRSDDLQLKKKLRKLLCHHITRVPVDIIPSIQKKIDQLVE